MTARCYYDSRPCPAPAEGQPARCDDDGCPARATCAPARPRWTATRCDACGLASSAYRAGDACPACPAGRLA